MNVVSIARFELAASCTPCTRATWLRHTEREGWCRGKDLNLPRQALQACALPTELPRRNTGGAPSGHRTRKAFWPLLFKSRVFTGFTTGAQRTNANRDGFEPSKMLESKSSALSLLANGLKVVPLTRANLHKNSGQLVPRVRLELTKA
jgi:hypothetical protein